MKLIDHKTGFTIVELLIVIVVIGILAAISIVSYNGIQNRTRLTAVHTDLSNAKKKLELYKSEYGRYPESNTELASAEISLSSNSNYERRTGGYSNFYYCVNLAENTFALAARVADGKPSSIYITSENSISEHHELMTGDRSCIVIGLAGRQPAQGAFSSFGLGEDGAPASWLNMNG